ncbi:Caveolin-1 [Halotydeus destructor]|nr:Caveolin-1 [Halotydeus destructor]
MTDKNSKTGSKTNLNESSLPLLDPESKNPEKEEKIELETKGGNDDKTTNTEEKDAGEKGKKKKEKKPKEPRNGGDLKKKSPMAYAQNFTVGLNVNDRDEKRINDHVNLTFEDIIGETDANQGFEFIWRLTFLFFNGIKFWLYRILAALLALPLAVIWAVVFALLHLVTVWGCTPTLRVYDVLLHHVHRVWAGLVRTFLDPIFTSIGQGFRKNSPSYPETTNV